MTSVCLYDDESIMSYQSLTLLFFIFQSALLHDIGEWYGRIQRVSDEGNAGEVWMLEGGCPNCQRREQRSWETRVNHLFLSCYCTTPYNDVLYCTVLYFTVLYCNPLYRTLLHCDVVYRYVLYSHCICPVPSLHFR
jgi:hypothetical protein